MTRQEAQEEYNKELIKRQIATYYKLQDMFDETVTAILQSYTLKNLPIDEFIKIRDYTQLYNAMNGEVKKLNATMYSYVRTNSEWAWNLSNAKTDAYIKQEFEKRQLAAPPNLLKHDTKALDSYLKRKVGGLTVSKRVWNITAGFKKQLEEAVSAAVGEGKSASKLAMDIKKYLNNPDGARSALYKKADKLDISASAVRYNPGQGVYRGAFKNALRLARNEINLAFHKSEQERWSKLNFIVGYRVRNSRNRVSTVCPICKAIDNVAFPKSIHVLPVHIQCMCTATTIQCSDEQFKKVVADPEYKPSEIKLTGKALQHVNTYLKR